MELMKNGNAHEFQKKNEGLIQKIYGTDEEDYEETLDNLEVLHLPEQQTQPEPTKDMYHYAEDVEEEETLSLQDKDFGSSSRKT